MWRVTAKGLWAKKLRLLLTSLSVVLGVAFVSGSFVLTDTISGIFDGLFEGAYANTDTAVRSSIKLTSSQQGPSPGTKRETIPKDLVTTIRRELPSTVVEGRYVQRYAQIFKRGKAIQNTHAPTFGTVWGADPLLNSVYKIDSGHPPRNGSQVAVDEGTAERHDLAVGDKVSIGFSTGAKRPFTISGVFRFGDAGSLAGATMASFDPKTAEEVLGAAGQYDLIVVRSTAGLSQQELTAAVAKILPPGASAVTGKVLAAETASELQKNLGFFNIFLLVFAFIALFVGMFIIYNTFSIIVAQRSKELALLRAIGASGRQVMRSVAVEALATGVVSSLLGIAAGIGLAITLKATFGAAGFSLPDGPTVILPRTLIVSFAAGVIVTFVSAIFPARRAARVPPVAAMREQVYSPGQGNGRYWTGSFVTIAGAGLLALGLVGNLIEVVGLATGLVFIGVAMLSPLFARPFARFIGAGPAHQDGITGELARENALRNPRRTASTASALMIGLALISLVAITSSSIKSTLTSVLDESVAADFFVQSAAQGQPFSNDVVAALRSNPATSKTAGFRAGGFKVGEDSKLLLATDGRYLAETFSVEMTTGSLASLEDQGVIIFDDVAKEQKLSIGDSLQMRFASQGYAPVEVPVVGTYAENRALSTNYLLSLNDFERYFGPDQQGDIFAAVSVPEGHTVAEAARTMKAVTSRYPVKIQNQDDFIGDAEAQLDQIVNLVFILLALSVFIAVIGVINTLTLSVIERTHELGLLRAVGMSQRQSRVMIRWEAMIIGVFGGVLGILLGALFGRALVLALADEGLKFALPGASLWSIVVIVAAALGFSRFSFWKAIGICLPLIVVFSAGRTNGFSSLNVPGGQLVNYAVLAAIVGLAAAAWPSWRASKLDVLGAVSTQ